MRADGAGARVGSLAGALALVALLASVSACRDQNEPGPTTRARKEREAAVKRAAAEAAARPPPPIAFGAKHLPPLLAGVELGMTPRVLAAARPNAYEAPNNPDAWREELGTRTSAHYGFYEGRLYSVLVLGFERAKEADALRAVAEKRWGPMTFGRGKLYRAGDALVRIDVDMGNLIVEFTAEPAEKKETAR